MAVQIDPLPDAPQRNDAPSTFIEKADAWVAALVPWTTQANALADEAETNAIAAGNSASQAANSATAADNAADAALGAANFKGNWSDLTGPLNIPASVFHVGTVWLLLVNLPDVTLSEPSDSNPDWTPLLQDLAWCGPETTNINLGGCMEVLFDISAGSLTATLPGTLSVGQFFTLHPFGSDSNTLTVERNGNTITANGQNIDAAGDGNLILRGGDTVKLVATSTNTAEIA